MEQPYEKILETFNKDDFFEWLKEEGELDKWEAALENKDHYIDDYLKWRQYNDYLSITVLNYKNLIK